MKLPRSLSAVLASCALVSVALAQNAAPQNTVITSAGPGEMVSTDTETTITFRDKVVVTGTNMKLACDYLEVVVVRTGDKSATIGKVDKFRSMIATGNVQMIQGDREAACGRAVVLPEEEKVVLSEDPVVVDHDQNMRFAGRTITMYRAERRLEIDKPILTAPPVKDLGVDKVLKPATSPTATSTGPTTPPAQP